MSSTLKELGDFSTSVTLYYSALSCVCVFIGLYEKRSKFIFHHLSPTLPLIACDMFFMFMT